jgi:hypothetical protein
MIRVLVALSPRMYRQAIALSIHRNRPGLDVRATPPEAAAGEIKAFRPHLLVHNDTAPIPEGALAGVPCRVEVLYSDSMDARVSADGRLGRIGDMDVGGLLRVVDRAAALAGGEVDAERTPG